MVAKRSTKMGKLNPYVDVRSEKDIPKFESLLKTGDVYVLVYADWCGHCQRFKHNMWNEVANSNQRKVNTAAVHYNMVDKTSMKNANIEGYPTLFEVKATPKANVSTPVPTPQNKEELEKLVGINKNTLNKINTIQESEDPQSINNIMSNRMMTNSAEATENTFEPSPLNSIPPDTTEDLVTNEVNTVKQGGGQSAGSLMETLLKVAANSAHVAILATSASEFAHRYKRRQTKKKRSAKKKSTRKH